MSRTTRSLSFITVCATLTAAFMSATGATAQTAGIPAWLDQVNAYRASAGVTPFTENPRYSDLSKQRAREIVETNEINPRQDPTGNWCINEAQRVVGAQQSAFPYEISDAQILDLWMGSAFQGILSLNPMLVETGFGSFHDLSSDAYKVAAVMCLAGFTSDRTYLQYPVRSPGPDSVTNLLSANEFENPSPLTACPGYRYPVGSPISIQLRQPAALTATTLTKDGVEIAHCAFDATTYKNSDPAREQLALSVLEASNAAVIIPKDPLVVGSTYMVTMTFGSVSETWSFEAGTQTIWSSQVGVGSQTSDDLAGTDIADKVYALGGDDQISSGSGSDLVYAGEGNDSLAGGVGGDMVNGEAGSDVVEGGGGDDRLYGRGGKDKLNGGKGLDKLNAGGGDDLCIVDSKREKRAAKGCETIRFAGRRAHR